MNRHENIKWKMEQLKKEQRQMIKEWEKEAADIVRKEIPNAVSIDTLKKVRAFLKAVKEQKQNV